jgi:hypothetical protein
MLTGHDDGKIYRWAGAVLSDAGKSIPCKWTSQDFTSKQVFGRPGLKLSIERIACEYAGTGTPTTLNFWISVNSGKSWTGPYPMILDQLSSGFHTGHITQRQLGDRIRFKFENNTTDENFRISSFEIEFELHEQRTAAE